jgi:endonuclease YncB( thermonuclease family)
MDRADKYGRWLAAIHFRGATGAWVDLTQELLRLGLAREAPWR